LLALIARGCVDGLDYKLTATYIRRLRWCYFRPTDWYKNIQGWFPPNPGCSMKGVLGSRDNHNPRQFPLMLRILSTPGRWRSFPSIGLYYLRICPYEIPECITFVLFYVVTVHVLIVRLIRLVAWLSAWPSGSGRQRFVCY